MTEQKPTYSTMMEKRTLEWQLNQLRQLVEASFVKTAKEVKGSFTTGDYVTWLLNEIFTPACWGFIILRGPEMITLNDKSAYAQVVGRLEVTFADESTTHQDDIGIWPLRATDAKHGGTLEDTAPERYETACKAARTDCLKNATYNLGTCFAPLSDGALVGFLQRVAARNNIAHLTENETAKESADVLFGVAEARSNGAIPVTSSEDHRKPKDRDIELADSLSGVVAQYLTNELSLPGWVAEMRKATIAHAKANEPAKNGAIETLLRKAERRVTLEQFYATVNIILGGREPEEMTIGEWVALQKFVGSEDFEVQVVSLLS